MIFIGTQLTPDKIASNNSYMKKEKLFSDSAFLKLLVINLFIVLIVFLILPRIKKTILHNDKLNDFITTILPFKSSDYCSRYKLYIDISLIVLIIIAVLPIILYMISGNINILLVFFSFWILGLIHYRPKLSELNDLYAKQRKHEDDHRNIISDNQSKVPTCPKCKTRQPWLIALMNMQLSLLFQLPKWECNNCKSKLSFTYKGLATLWLIAFPIGFTIIWGLIHLIKELPISESLYFITHFISMGVILMAIPLLVIISKYLGVFKIIVHEGE